MDMRKAGVRLANDKAGARTIWQLFKVEGLGSTASGLGAMNQGSLMYSKSRVVVTGCR